MNGLTGRVALITGIAGWMGTAIAERLSADGVKIVGIARAVDAPEKTGAKLTEAGVDAEILAGDLADPATIPELVARAERRFGRIDIVVNGAAAVDQVRAGAESAVVDETDEAWNRQVAVNLWAPMALARAVLPGMVQRRQGAFVSISSWTANRAVPSLTGYNVTKAGLMALDRQIACDYGQFGIRANTVLTGMIRVAQNTGMHDAEVGAQIRERVQMLPSIGRPIDIANAVAFLASDESAFVTGAALPVEGGAIAKGAFPGDLFAEYLAILKRDQTTEAAASRR
jgi:NAD(P)-dependent dehydrogenase (short-subunit alcohol dehydrogenase family)